MAVRRRQGRLRAADTKPKSIEDSGALESNSTRGPVQNAKSKTSRKGAISSKCEDPSDDKLDIANAYLHLPPLPLVFTVLICSGIFWVSSFRDVLATGKPILDTLGPLWGQSDGDANLLRYTKSTYWFDDSRGWKSKQGGLSTILPVTTDENNMGGLFIRKMAGAAGLAFHTTKLWPLVFHSPPKHYLSKKQGHRVVDVLLGTSWKAGHFDPLLAIGMIGDISLALFYLVRLDELKNVGAGGLAMAYVFTSLVEALMFGLYLINRRMKSLSEGKKMGMLSAAAKNTNEEYDPQEDPDSFPSRIVARTVLIVSSLISTVSIRELLFPGHIISFIPRDDIFLEWTNAFLHSPPPDTIEADEYGLEAALFAGDKFVSQLLGLYLSLGCLLKFASSWGWSKGSRKMTGFGGKDVENTERSGLASSKIIWKTQAFGNLLLLSILRLFTPAAKSASLDLRWHLILVAYEMFILFLYGFL